MSTTGFNPPVFCVFFLSFPFHLPADRLSRRCSNGCGVDVGVKDGKVVGVRGRAVDRVNKGRLGPKGCVPSLQQVGGAYADTRRAECTAGRRSTRRTALRRRFASLLSVFRPSSLTDTPTRTYYSSSEARRRDSSSRQPGTKVRSLLLSTFSFLSRLLLPSSRLLPPSADCPGIPHSF
jgi:hypothetical protein